jgi:hypothetical protein
MVKEVFIMQEDKKRKRNTKDLGIDIQTRKDGTKYLMQWKWRCTFRDAFYVCCVLWPHAHTKLPKIQQVINHYEGVVMNDKVVDLLEYKRIMNLE